MTAGLDWNQFSSDVSINDGTKLWQSDNRLRYVMEKKLVEPMGAKFNYNSGLSVLLGGIVKETTRYYCNKFAEKNLFEPLGISNYKWDLGQWRIDVGGTVGKIFGDKFELFHSAKNQFYGKLKNIGHAKIVFVSNNQNNIESLNAKIG